MKFIKILFVILISFSAVACSKHKETPTVLVVFGATGDLTARKVLPAVEKLTGEKRLPEKFAVVGVARKSEEEFRKQIVFGQNLYYCQTNFDDDEGYGRLSELLDRIDRDFGAKSNRIYFLATQPSYFSTIVKHLSDHHLIYQLGVREWSRVMIEKPFGHDLDSAIELQEQISQYLDESQIYRIDHYLGKEGVQNLIAFRERSELEARWNKEGIDRVEIILSEEIGIGTRATLWEETGLLRDVVQNHIMQLVALVAKEPKSEKLEVLEAVRPIETAILGQYGSGFINGSYVVGYKEEKGVSKTSKSETLVAAKLFIDNARWEGVPFQILAGKRLAQQLTEIVVFFKNGELLHIRIQPKPAIYFEGSPEIAFEPFPFTEAYQKLIYDCIRGDQSSFVRKEEEFASWRVLDRVLHEKEPIVIYPAGSQIDSISLPTSGSH